MTTWRGDVYRATTYDEPLWVAPNRRDGRFNLAGQGSTQYLCLDSEAPYAEMLRGEDLRSETDAATFRTILWQLRVDEGAVADYGTFAKAEEAGCSLEVLVDDDQERSQAEAQRLKSLGARALLSPSAALPGSTNLTVFGPRTPVAWSVGVRLASAIPVQRLTEGSAPRGLMTRVGYYGDVHAALAAYQRSAAP